MLARMGRCHAGAQSQPESASDLRNRRWSCAAARHCPRGEIDVGRRDRAPLPDAFPVSSPAGDLRAGVHRAENGDRYRARLSPGQQILLVITASVSPIWRRAHRLVVLTTFTPRRHCAAYGEGTPSRLTQVANDLVHRCAGQSPQTECVTCDVQRRIASRNFAISTSRTTPAGCRDRVGSSLRRQRLNALSASCRQRGRGFNFEATGKNQINPVRS